MAKAEAKQHQWEARTPLYKVWICMKQRCHNPNYRGYKHYGARGISVCPEWFMGFAAFRDWANANGYREGLSIDRIDNDGGYCPENCRWIPRGENSKKTRRSRVCEAFGESKSVSEWSRDPRCVVSLITLNGRIRRGWEFAEALTTPPAKDQDEAGRFTRTRTASDVEFVPYKPAD